MKISITLAETFVLALVAVLFVALLFRLAGRKPNLLLMLSVAVGVTVAKAIQHFGSISETFYPLVLGMSVGLSALVASHLGRRNHRDA